MLLLPPKARQRRCPKDKQAKEQILESGHENARVSVGRDYPFFYFLVLGTPVWGGQVWDPVFLGAVRNSKQKER